MNKLAILCALAATPIYGNTIDGWFYLGPTAKYTRIENREFPFIEGGESELTINKIRLDSFGVVAGLGISPGPFFLSIEGSYTELYSSKYNSTTIFEGETNESPTIPLKGDFYTYEVKGGYLFQPLCNVPWSLYPLISYTSDSIIAKFDGVPEEVDEEIQVNSAMFRPKVVVKGPAIGLGTTYNLPYGFTIQASGSWQWRHLIINTQNKFSITFDDVFTLNGDQRSNQMGWLQGAMIDLGLQYDYCNWFIGVEGKWYYLQQIGKISGINQDFIFNDQGKEFNQSTFTTKEFIWKNWIWKVFVGYAF